MIWFSSFLANSCIFTTILQNGWRDFFAFLTLGACRD
ncbi:hypothetical protein NEOC65_001891 [Neochlamydia sp. AcF65]|nr:hypothetical protein [Neochlamydia sp. AcF65]